MPAHRGHDKHTKTNAVADMFSSGAIWAPLGRRWAQEVVEEMAAFPYAAESEAYEHTRNKISITFNLASTYVDRAAGVIKRFNKCSTGQESEVAMPFRFTPRNCGACHYHFVAGCLLAVLFYAVPVLADPTYTVFQVPEANIGPYPNGINLSGTVIGTYLGPGNPIFHDYGTYGFVRDPSGTITTLNLSQNNQAGGPYTAPMAINNTGTIVGEFTDYRNAPHSFMRDANGAITTFDPPQCSETISAAYGINAEGAIVGVCIYDASSSYVRNTDGTFQTFKVRGAGQTWAVGINMAYLVTGFYTDANRNYHGFVGWPNSNLLTRFDPPGSVRTQPTSINSVGAITGSYRDAASVDHGFVRGPLGNIVSFDPGGSKDTYPTGINDAGAIVGTYHDSNGISHGFVRDPTGAITSFDPPGSKQTYAQSINDHGVITGYFLGTGLLGFVRTP